MKKNNKAYATGWVVLVVAVIAAIILGQLRKPQTTRVEKYVVDNADILSAATEKTLHSYNADWLDRYGGVTAVVTVDSADDVEESAYKWADQLGLNDSCVILLISAGDHESVYIWGYDLDGVMKVSTRSELGAVTDAMVLSGEYDHCVKAFFQLLDEDVYNTRLLASYAGGGSSSGAAIDAGVLLFLVFIFVAVMLLVLFAIEQSRFTAYRRAYYGIPGAPVFRPIFFWHVPGSGWYRRHWRPAPPPPPPPIRTPSGGGFHFGGSSHSSGSSHFSHSSSSFHAGGSSRSGGFHAGGSSRSGGGFRAGGSSRSSGGFRSGGSSRSGGGFRGRR